MLLAGGVGSAQQLPDGPGRVPLTARCSACHESDLVVQQRLSAAGWGREIDKMVRWGAVVEPPERALLLDYLAAHFAPKTVVAKAPAAPVGYERACLVCHEADLIAAQRLTRAGWTREVDKMIRWGAAVPEAEKTALLDYLATTFPVRPR
jgi:cytochrome c5